MWTLVIVNLPKSFIYCTNLLKQLFIGFCNLKLTEAQWTCLKNTLLDCTHTPFPESHVIGSRLFSGKNLCSGEPLRVFNLFICTPGFLRDVFELQLFAFGCILYCACGMCIDGWDFLAS